MPRSPLRGLIPRAKLRRHSCNESLPLKKYLTHNAALRLPELDPWEVKTERSYYKEHVLSPDKKHEGADILVSEKAPPHESG